MILVFGSTGQVATELQRQAAPRITALFRTQADLTDPGACAAQIRAHAPSAVINAAAYTAVDRAEEEEALAHVINADAPGAMARTCADLGIPFLHISTDYVFPGTGTAAHHPDDPTGPQNAYGRTKLAGEVAVRAASGTHAILRTSWVVSPHGANFVKTMLHLTETRDALAIVNDQIGGPTAAHRIAATLLTMAEAMIAGQDGGTFHYAGQPATCWADFACEIFSQAGRKVTVTGVPTTEYPTPARRPLNSRLDCNTLTQRFGITPPDWRADLTHILKALT